MQRNFKSEIGEIAQPNRLLPRDRLPNTSQFIPNNIDEMKRRTMTGRAQQDVLETEMGYILGQYTQMSLGHETREFPLQNEFVSQASKGYGSTNPINTFPKGMDPAYQSFMALPEGYVYHRQLNDNYGFPTIQVKQVYVPNEFGQQPYIDVAGFNRPSRPSMR